MDFTPEQVNFPSIEDVHLRCTVSYQNKERALTISVTGQNYKQNFIVKKVLDKSKGGNNKFNVCNVAESSSVHFLDAVFVFQLPHIQASSQGAV